MRTEYHHQFPEKEVSKMALAIGDYAKTVRTIIDTTDYTAPESALAIAGDVEYQEAIAQTLAPYTDVRHVVLVGIGGSSLGTEAVYAALKTADGPTLTVLDSLEPASFTALAALLTKVKNPKHIVLVVVSKSGTTTETVCNADLALNMFESTYGATAKEQTIVIGDTTSTLLEQAKERNILTFSIPDAIGGRYSVWTAVGIVPLTLLGIDVKELLRGAVAGIGDDACQSAAVLAAGALNGIRTVNFFTFSDRLETLGYWYRQLLAESIGKSHTKQGEDFSYALLPTVSSSVDLHSMAQLYLGGYEGVYTRFLEIREEPGEQLRTSTWISEAVPSLHGVSLTEVKRAIAKGVLLAYDEAGLPYQFSELEKCDAYTIGYLLSQLMFEVMCLGHALGVDAFDQPHVELYKKHVREMLTS